MSDQPFVSIITINYNQVDVTCELLQSLRKNSYPNYEVIVVDNASKINPSEIITKNFPEVNLILSKENLGFAGGNNLGIKAARGKYLLFLNNDTEVKSNFLNPLVLVMESDPRIGMASPKIIYFNTEIIQYAGAMPINPFTGRGRKIGNKERDNGQFNVTRETYLGHGAALMVSAEMIKKIGLMPEIYFLYYEEHDWCETAKRAGYKIYFVANSEIYHKESMSVGKNNPMKTYYMSRNRILFMRRNVFGFKLTFSLLFLFFISIPKNILKYLLKMEGDHLKAFYKGLLWNTTNLNLKK